MTVDATATQDVLLDLADEIEHSQLTETESTNGYASIDNYGDLFEDVKARKRFIKKCVSQCRTSPEYRRYRNFLIENMNLDKCSILSNIPSEDLHSNLEIHHYPFTLYDICETIMNKHILEEGCITTFRISHEVMELHWRNMVGLIPLSQTMHEAAHDYQLKLHPSMIFGKWFSFVKENLDFFTDELKIRFQTEIKNWDQIIEKGLELDAFEVDIAEWAEFDITIQDLLSPKPMPDVIEQDEGEVDGDGE